MSLSFKFNTPFNKRASTLVNLPQVISDTIRSTDLLSLFDTIFKFVLNVFNLASISDWSFIPVYTVASLC